MERTENRFYNCKRVRAKVSTFINFLMDGLIEFSIVSIYGRAVGQRLCTINRREIKNKTMPKSRGNL